jgi:flagellin
VAQIKILLDDIIDGSGGTLAYVSVGISSVTNEGLNLEMHIDMSDFISDFKGTNGQAFVNSLFNSYNPASPDVGAMQNRLEHVIGALNNTAENLTASESRIRDIDMAKEMMGLTKSNILTQAAQAMLAQANQQLQGILQLLR